MQNLIKPKELYFKMQIKKRLECLYLDLLSLPGIFLNKKYNAKFHLKCICPRCPEWRKEMRKIDKKGCFWFNNWKSGNYTIPKSFGIKNKICQYLNLRVNLNFKNL